MEDDVGVGAPLLELAGEGSGASMLLAAAPGLVAAVEDDVGVHVPLLELAGEGSGASKPGLIAAVVDEVGVCVPLLQLAREVSTSWRALAVATCSRCVNAAPAPLPVMP